MATNGSSVICAGATLGQHRHICAFFNDFDEQHRVLRSFIKEGFDRGDKAFHIVDPELWEDHLRQLTEAGIDEDAMLALLEEVLQSGEAAGYPLTRFVSRVETALVDKAGVDSWLEYETRVNYVVPKYDDPVICTYDLSKFSASMVMDMMRTHPVVIIGGVVQENPFFVPPDQFLLELRERRRSPRAQ